MFNRASDPHNESPPAGLAAQLTRRGLPADYARRAAAEMADHHRDLIDELQAGGMSASHAATEAARRLGDPRTLVKNTVREYQRRYWCGRWPLITFLLGPIPLLVLTWAVFSLVAFCVLWPLDKLGLVGPYEADGIVSTGEWLANLAMVIVICFIAPSVTMFALARLAKRAALDWKWLIVSACLLGLTIGTIRCGFPAAWQRPTMADGKPVLADQPLVTVGIPFFAPSWRWALRWYMYDLQQISQVLLPLVLAAVFAMRAKQLSLQSQRLVVDGC